MVRSPTRDVFPVATRISGGACRTDARFLDWLRWCGSTCSCLGITARSHVAQSLTLVALWVTRDHVRLASARVDAFSGLASPSGSAGWARLGSLCPFGDWLDDAPDSLLSARTLTPVCPQQRIQHPATRHPSSSRSHSARPTSTRATIRNVSSLATTCTASTHRAERDRRGS